MHALMCAAMGMARIFSKKTRFLGSHVTSNSCASKPYYPYIFGYDGWMVPERAMSCFCHSSICFSTVNGWLDSHPCLGNCEIANLTLSWVSEWYKMICKLRCSRKEMWTWENPVRHGHGHGPFWWSVSSVYDGGDVDLARVRFERLNSLKQQWKEEKQ